MRNGTPIWGTNTLAHFDQAIEKIKSISGIDAVIVTGDLSNDGSVWSYRYIDNRFGELGIQTFCCPGNHDNIPVMMNEYVPSSYTIIPKAFLSGYKLIMLNTVVPDEEIPGKNKARGYIGPLSFESLQNELQDGIPTVIALHHPPIEPGGWLNRKLLENRNDFIALVERFGNVPLVLYGHTHYALVTYSNGVKYIGAPAVGYAFDKEYGKFEIVPGNEGMNIIDISSSGITVSKIILGVNG